MRIIFDMDDTLVGLLDEWLKYLNSYKGIPQKTREDILEWDMRKSYPDLTDEQLYNILSKEQLWNTVQPIVGATECLDKLKQDGHSLYIATASYPLSYYIKLTHCLFKHFTHFNPKNVICIYDKYLLKCDVLVDDNPENLRRSTAVRILIDAPHNRTCDKECYDYRVNTFEEIYNIIKNIDNARSELYYE